MYFVGVAVSCFELLLIQQQNFGGSLMANIQKLYTSHKSTGIFMRGAPLASIREACFTASYVGVVPIVQRHLSLEYNMNQTKAAVIGSVGSGLVATAISHPIDIVKTNMQGNVNSFRWRTIRSATSTLYETRGLTYMFTAGLVWRAALNTCSIFLFNELKIRLAPLMFPHVFQRVQEQNWYCIVVLYIMHIEAYFTQTRSLGASSVVQQWTRAPRFCSTCSRFSSLFPHVSLTTAFPRAFMIPKPVHIKRVRENERWYS